MCNWGWLISPITGILMDKEQKKTEKAKNQAKLANQQLEQGLIDKENEKNEALENVNQAVNTDPIKSGDISNTSLTPKRTISTLALPFKNSGLNVR